MKINAIKIEEQNNGQGDSRNTMIQISVIIASPNKDQMDIVGWQYKQLWPRPCKAATQTIIASVVWNKTKTLQLRAKLS